MMSCRMVPWSEQQAFLWIRTGTQLHRLACNMLLSIEVEPTTGGKQGIFFVYNVLSLTLITQCNKNAKWTNCPRKCETNQETNKTMLKVQFFVIIVRYSSNRCPVLFLLKLYKFISFIGVLFYFYRCMSPGPQGALRHKDRRYPPSIAPFIFCHTAIAKIVKHLCNFGRRKLKIL